MITINNKDYIPKSVGLQQNPPTIVIEYLIPSSNRLYRHKIKLTKLSKDSNVKEFVNYIKQRHKDYVDNDKITDYQLQLLVERLIQKQWNQQKTYKQNPQPIQQNNQNNSNNLNQKKQEQKPTDDFEYIDDEEYPEDFEEKSDLDASVDSKLDLNKLSVSQVQMYKNKMEKNFYQLKPGMEGYVYDNQKQFAPTKMSDWDD